MTQTKFLWVSLQKCSYSDYEDNRCKDDDLRRLKDDIIKTIQ